MEMFRNLVRIRVHFEGKDKRNGWGKNLGCEFESKSCLLAF
jgi:hypothetical protein